MLDTLNKDDILNLSVRGTDFLCHNSPLVSAVELYRSSDRRRTRAFLLGGNMPSGNKKGVAQEIEILKKGGENGA